jgi:DnaJ-class molecular chaperone
VKDYYKILELSPDASQEDIKHQWRFFVQAWHPDKFANLDHKRQGEEKFKEVTEAYEVLRHPDSRQAYNALRAEEEHQRKAQTERAVQERKREELRKQEKPARNRAREEQRRIAHVTALWHRADDELERTVQVIAARHSAPLRCAILVFILLWMTLLMWIYDPEGFIWFLFN